MSRAFDELARASTPMGDIVLRRRLEPTLQIDVFEDWAWLTSAVRGICGASLHADIGHTSPTALLPSASACRR